MSHVRSWLPRVTIAVFSLLAVLSLTAGLTGIDPDDRWGLLRRAAFAIGAVGVLGTACLQGLRALDRRLMSKSIAAHGAASESGSQPAEMEPGHPQPLVPPPARADRRWVPLAVGALTVAIIGVTYIGLVSVWHWAPWPATTPYYGMLADAFTQGHTYLPIEPPSGLSKLANPYARGSWVGVNGIPNLTYYQGRYYMYWGPAPALALAILRLFSVQPPGDEVVVFAAISGIFLTSALIILRLRRTYFEGLSPWLTIAGLVIVGTVHPMLWIQNSPSVLTAAIACGQAFLLGGVYFMVRAMTDAQASAANYAAAGALWGLAMASRLTTGASVGVLVIGVAFLEWRRIGPLHRYKTAAVNMASLLVPLGIALGLYGWYNLIRFGNPLETGFRYALTEFDIGAELERGSIFNWRYLASDALYYLLAPIRPIPRFPYLRPVYYEYPLFTQVLTRFGVPAEHRVEDAAGLLLAAPCLLFAAIFARKWFYGDLPRGSGGAEPAGGAAVCPPDQGQLGSLLLLSGLAGMVPIFLFFYTTTRYQMDFVPLLAIVAVLGMWRLHADTRGYPLQGRLAAAAIVLIVTAGVLVSLLLAVSGAGSRFDDLNPGVYSYLVNLFPHW